MDIIYNKKPNEYKLHEVPRKAERYKVINNYYFKIGKVLLRKISNDFSNNSMLRYHNIL